VQTSTDETTTNLMHNAWIDFRVKMLNYAVDKKEAVFTFLEEKIHPAAYRGDLLTCVRKVGEDQRLVNGVDVDTPMGQGSGAATPTQSTAGSRRRLPADSSMDWIDTDYTLVKIDVLALASRVVGIIRARDLVAIQKSLAKLSLQHAAMEVEPGTRGRLQQDYKNFEEVGRIVQAALAKRKKRKAKKGKGPADKNAKKDKKPKNDNGKKRPASQVLEKVEKKKPKKGKKRKKASESIALSSWRFNYQKASTFPDNVLESKKLAKEVHVVGGPVLPREVQNWISLGLRYLLHVPYNI